jgi:hypothetical protein
MQPDQLFFATMSPPPPAEALKLPAGYEAEFWTPGGLRFVPDELGLIPFFVWSVIFHHGRIFRNRGYQLLLIRKDGGLVHRSCIFPGYFRFPFMAARDLQVGDTWTAPAERGKGLARWALTTAIRRLATDGRTLWYICDQDNPASAAVAVRTGMKLVGWGVRTRRFGLNLLGKFEIVGYNSSQTS